jgi:hypothetical protein
MLLRKSHDHAPDRKNDNNKHKAMWIFEVVPEGDSWKVVQLEGAGVLISIHSSKEMAIADGSRAASENEPSHLIIKTADRRIEKKVVYGRGATVRPIEPEHKPAPCVVIEHVSGNGQAPQLLAEMS